MGLGVRRGEWCLYVYIDNTSLPSYFCLQRIDAQRQARQSSLQRQVRERNAAQLKTWEQNTATQLTEQERLKHQERVKQLQVCARSAFVVHMYPPTYVRRCTRDSLYVVRTYMLHQCVICTCKLRVQLHVTGVFSYKRTYFTNLYHCLIVLLHTTHASTSPLTMGQCMLIYIAFPVHHALVQLP